MPKPHHEPTASFASRQVMCPDCGLLSAAPPATNDVTCESCGRQFTIPEKPPALSTVDFDNDGTSQWDGARKDEPPTSLPEIPGYEIVRLLGRGGMGVVYLARELALNRLVALKMLRGGALEASESADKVARFRREAEAIARLRHPNIVQIFAIAECAAGPFFTMEYLELGSLARHTRSEPQAPRSAARIVLKLAEATHAAHARGIVHRDLKPGNVLLQGVDAAATPLAADVVPKISDFGLAKDLEHDVGQTHAGAILGTPSYMAPEQAAADGENLGPLVDVYALGAILYELLTGRPPFRGKTTLETLELLRNTEPVRPSRLQAGLGDLETICLKCLDKNPARRYASAHELANDLRAYINGEPIRARPVGNLERTWKWVKRRPAPAGLIAVSLLALVGLAAFVSLDYAKSQQHVKDLQDENFKTEQARIALKDQNQQTELARRQAVERAVRQTVATGLKYEQDGDLLGALLYFTEAALMEDRDSPSLVQHRLRLSAALQHSPKLAELWWHEKPVTAVAFNPHQPHAVSASLDGTIRGWHLDGAVPLFETAPRHPDAVNHLAYSHDGQRLASAGEDMTARLWEAATGKAIGEPLPHRAPVTQVAFSPAGAGALLTVSGTRFAAQTMRDGPRTMVPQRIVTGVNRFGVPQFTTIMVPGPSTGSIPTNPRGYVQLWGDPTSNKPTWLGSVNGWINRADFSPDGRHISAAGAAVTGSNAAVVWELAKGPKAEVSIRHPLQVNWTAFAPDGKRLVVASGRIEPAAGEARVFDAATGQPLGPPLKHDGAVTQAIFSPDGDRIVTASLDGTARIWDAATGEPVTDRLVHRDVVSFAAFSLDGQQVLTASWDGAVRIWSTATGQQVVATLKHPSPVTSASIHPSRPLVLTGCQDGSVRVWDVATPAFARTVLRQRDVLPPPAQIMTTAQSASKTLHVSRVLPGLIATGAIFSPDGASVLASAGMRTLDQVPGGGEARSSLKYRTTHLAVWDATAAALRYPPLQHTFSAAAAHLATDVMLVGCQPQRGAPGLDLIEVHSGRILGSMAFDKDEAPVALTSAGGGRVLTQQRSLKPAGIQLRVRATADGADLTEPWLAADPEDAVFSADGKLLACLFTAPPRDKEQSPRKVVEIRAVDGGQAKRTLELPFEPNRIAFSPDASVLAAYRSELVHGHGPTPVASDVAASLHHLATGAVVLVKHKSAILHLTFSANGQQVATASADRTARVWDTASGNPVTPPLEHRDKVTQVAFAGEERLASGSLDGTARVWDIATGEPLTPRLRHGDGVLSVAFDASGERLATACVDGAVRIWDLRPNTLTFTAIKQQLETICGHRVDATLGLSALDRQALEKRWGKRTPWSPDAKLVQNWRREALHEAELAGNRHAQVVLLDAWLHDVPDNRDLRLRRGRLHGQAARWTAAEADYAAAAALAPLDHDDLVTLTLLQLAVGKKDASAPGRTLLLERCVESQGAVPPLQALRLSLLTQPGTADEAERLLRLAEKLAADKQLAPQPMMQQTLALASIRAGRQQEALRPLAAAVKTSPDSVWNDLVRAVLAQREGNADAATRSVQAARQALDADRASPRPRLTWRERLEAEALLRDLES